MRGCKYVFGILDNFVAKRFHFFGTSEREKGIDPGPFRYVVEYAADRKQETWQTLVNASENTEDLCIDYRQFAPVKAYAIRLRILGAPKGITPGLTSLTAFGRCEG